MRHEQAISNRIIEKVSWSPGCLLEDLTLACPSLTWNEAFIEIDRLSRNGTLLLDEKALGCTSFIFPANALILNPCLNPPLTDWNPTYDFIKHRKGSTHL